MTSAPARRYVVEAVGLAALTVAVGTGVRTGTLLAPVVIAVTLMVMIYVGGRLTGAHYHPAVTLAMSMSGRMSLGHAMGCMGAQLTGALAGSAVVTTVVPLTRVPPPVSTTHLAVVTTAEVLFAFALCRVAVSGSDRTAPPTRWHRLRTAVLVTVGAVVVGRMSGGAFNPSIAICGSLTGMFSGPAAWVYVVAQIGTGALVHSRLSDSFKTPRVRSVGMAT